MGRVRKCICHDRSFVAIKQFAEDHGITNIEELQRRKICSCGCKLCVPYVKEMLKTGQTAFVPGSDSE